MEVRDPPRGALIVSILGCDDLDARWDVDEDAFSRGSQEPVDLVNLKRFDIHDYRSASQPLYFVGSIGLRMRIAAICQPSSPRRRVIEAQSSTGSSAAIR